MQYYTALIMQNAMPGSSAGRLGKKASEKPECHIEDVSAVAVHICSLAEITAVSAAEIFIQIAGADSVTLLSSFQTLQELLLQYIFICPVGTYGVGEAVVVHVGKCIRGVVYELAHTVVVPEIPV